MSVGVFGLLVLFLVPVALLAVVVGVVRVATARLQQAATFVRDARDAGLADEEVVDLVRGALIDLG